MARKLVEMNMHCSIASGIVQWEDRLQTLFLSTLCSGPNGSTDREPSRVAIVDPRQRNFREWKRDSGIHRVVWPEFRTWMDAIISWPVTIRTSCSPQALSQVPGHLDYVRLFQTFHSRRSIPASLTVWPLVTFISERERKVNQVMTQEKDIECWAMLLRFIWRWFHKKLPRMYQWKVMRSAIRRNHLECRFFAILPCLADGCPVDWVFDEPVACPHAFPIIKKVRPKSFHFHMISLGSDALQRDRGKFVRQSHKSCKHTRLDRSAMIRHLEGRLSWVVIFGNVTIVTDDRERIFPEGRFVWGGSREQQDW
jgi:hypothetical protein